MRPDNNSHVDHSSAHPGSGKSCEHGIRAQVSHNTEYLGTDVYLR